MASVTVLRSQSTHCPLAAASRARRSLFEVANKNINHSAGCFWQLLIAAACRFAKGSRHSKRAPAERQMMLNKPRVREAMYGSLAWTSSITSKWRERNADLIQAWRARII